MDLEDGSKSDPISVLDLKLSKAEPYPTGGINACVAVALFRSKSGINALLMRRSERDDDFWSGQIAFPGGGRENVDKSCHDTAIREMMEEMGLDLSANSKFLGYLKPLSAQHGGITVAPCVFWLQKEQEIHPNGMEVSSYKWIPLSKFSENPDGSIHDVTMRGEKLSVPSFEYDGYIIWGLTYHIIKRLVAFII
jgi:8-oxo-dGTP pyrophosphatase MutT (NUDIX family)